MHFDLHEDSPVSEYSRVEIYGLDYDKLLTLAGTRTERFNNFISPTPPEYLNYKLGYLYYNGPDLYKALSNTVPTDPEIGGCIFNRKNYMEDNGTGYVQHDAQLVPIDSEPDDYHTSVHYYLLELANVDIGGNIVTAAFPQWVATDPDFPYDSSKQYYRDEAEPRKRLARKFYFDSGIGIALHDFIGHNYWGTIALYGYGLWVSTDNNTYAYRNYFFGQGVNRYKSATDAFELGLGVARYGSSNVDSGHVMIGITFTKNDVEYVGFAVVEFSGGTDPYPTALHCHVIPREMVADNVYGTGEVGQGSWGPTSDTGGGGGSFDDTSDDAGDGEAQTTQDTQTAMNNAVSDCIVAGFQLHQLLTTSDYITPFYKVLFKTGTGSYLERFYQSAYDPTRAIVAFHKLPQALIQYRKSGGSVVSSHVTAAGYDISQQMYTDSGGSLNVDFPELEPIGSLYLGKIDFTQPYFDAFPDFAPYTKMYLHLPYIGVQEIDANKCMYGELSVSYYCEAITGNVAAHVWCKDKKGHSQYCYVCTGNAAYKLPVYSTGAGEGAIASGMAAIASAFSGNFAGAAMSGVSAALGAMQQSVQSSGSFGGSFGAISDETCWLEIVRPVWIQPDKYQKLRGLPSWVSGTIGNPGDGNQLNGYTVIPYIDLDGVAGATDWEKQEISRILSTGIEINGEL